MNELQVVLSFQYRQLFILLLLVRYLDDKVIPSVTRSKIPSQNLTSLYPTFNVMNDAGFRLGFRFAASSRDHRLAFHGYSSVATPLWLYTERHRSRVELKSTVCDMPQWTKRWGYRFIGKTQLAAWSSLCGKWRLRSCTNIIIKAAKQRAAN